MNIAESLLKTVRQRPEPAAMELLDFAEFLQRKYQAEHERAYQANREKALTLMAKGFDLGGRGIPNRNVLHER